jgi:hypothetical protein
MYRIFKSFVSGIEYQSVVETFTLIFANKIKQNSIRIMSRRNSTSRFAFVKNLL